MKLKATFNQNLNVLYIAEFFSSFAYFGLLSLLLLFFIQNLHMSQSSAYGLLGNYVGVSMIAALAGGVIGSQYLSARLCCLLGFVGYVAGYFLLINYQNPHSMHLGLSLVAGGFGLFEPNVQILFGAGFHTSSDSKRNIGFIIFYLFNIIGQFFGPIVLTYLNLANPHMIFQAAGVCSLLGLIFIAYHFSTMGVLEFSQTTRIKDDTFFRTCVAAFLLVIMVYILVQSLVSGLIDSLTAMVFIPWVVVIFMVFRKLLVFDEDIEMSGKFEKNKNMIIGALSVGILFILSFYTITHSDVKSLFILLFIPIVLFLMITVRKEPRVVKNHLISLFLLFGGAVVAVLCLRVCFGLIDLFTKNFVNETLWGWHIHTTLFDASEKMLIFLVFLGVIRVIKYFSDRKASLSYGGLMSFGLFMLATCFGCLALCITFTQGAKMSAMWLFLCYLFMAIGELCTIPIVISAIIGFSPRKWRGMMMGVKFMVIGVGAYYSDEIGKLIAPSVGNPTLQTYQHLFLNWMIYTALFALLLYFIWRKWNAKTQRDFLLNAEEKN